MKQRSIRSNAERAKMIACLGWGSLIWDPRELPVIRAWFSDGPMLPIEFKRVSDDKRLTLVITPGAAPVRVLWSSMIVTDVEEAHEALVKRERCDKHPERIKCWKAKENSPELIPGLAKWAKQLDLDGVIWTGLEPRHQKDGDKGPSLDAAISHLRSLNGNQLAYAKHYIQMAPRQIDTEYRRAIEAEFKWCPIG